MTARRHVVRAEAELLEKMRDGWELGFYSGIDGSPTIQKGGLGRGGEAFGVAMPTFVRAQKHGLIAAVARKAGDPYYLTHYTLKEAK